MSAFLTGGIGVAGRRGGGGEGMEGMVVYSVVGRAWNKGHFDLPKLIFGE